MLKSICRFRLRDTVLGSAILGLAFLPPLAFAVGFGDLTVNSKLGEALDVEVELLSVSPTDLGTLEVGLASRADFNRAGVAYPELAGLVNFEIVESTPGQYYVSITSQDAVNATFLHFLMAANWSGGKVVREYTALLDPPLYSGSSGAVVEVPSVTGTGEAASSSPSQSSSGSAASFGAGTPGAVEVKRGDTLSGIVSRLGLTESVSLYQALSAMLEANPDAFVNGNMNRLKAGVTMTVPDISSISQISRGRALSEFQDQVAEYNQYLVGIGYSAAEPESSSAESSDTTETAAAAAAEVAPTVSTDPSLAETSPDLSPTTITEDEFPADQPEEAPEVPADIQLALDDELDGPQLNIGQDAGEENLVRALEGGQGEEAQVDALKAQLAELDETLLASGVENTEVKDRLAEIQAQVDRVSKLIEVEDSGLALTQQVVDDAAEPEIAVEAVTESQMETDETLVVADTASLADSSTEADAGENTESANNSVVDGSDAAAVAAVASTGDTSTSPDPDQGGDNGGSQGNQPESGDGQGSASNNQGTERKVSKNSLLDNLSGIFAPISDYVLKIIAALFVLVGGLIFYRRRKSQQEFEESMLDLESGQVSTATSQNTFRDLSATSGVDLASRDSGLELTIGGGMSYLSEEGIAGVAEEENEVVQAGAVDPLAEADVYLAYDRDEQAIQVLKEAYAQNPERLELAEKLLEIYHKQDERKAFDDLATDLRSRIGAKQHPIWTKVVSMGREVSPTNTLYTDTLETDQLNSEIELETAPSSALSGTALSDIPPSDQIEVMDLDLAELDIPSGASEDTVIKSLEVDDLDINLKDIPKQDRSLDAPTLSQIISAADAREMKGREGPGSPGGDTPKTADEGSVEFKLDDGDTDDLDSPSKLAAALAELEAERTEGMENLDRQLERAAEGDTLVLDDQEIEDIALETAAATADKAEPAEAEKPAATGTLADEAAAREDSYLSELSEQSTGGMEPYHESETALELAKAYMELGEKDIAKGFIEEVINEGSDKQKAKAEKLVKELVD